LNMTVNYARGTEICYENFSTATELANYLVTDHNLPFRQAHRIVGGVVSDLVARQGTLRESGLVVGLLAKQGVTVSAETVAEVVSPEATIGRNASMGGTGPAPTRRAIGTLQAEVAAIDKWRDASVQQIARARERTFEDARSCSRNSRDVS
jgi:argininosuccinate lyase